MLKTYCEPYFVIDDKSWIGLAITSHSSDILACGVVIYDAGGERVGDNVYLVPGGCIYPVMFNLPEGRYSMYLTYTDGLIHRLVQGHTGGFFYTQPVEVTPQLPIDYSKIQDKDWMRFNGKSSCRTLDSEYLIRLEHACKHLFIQFLARKDPVVNLGDASPVNGSCEGHPGASHGQRKSIDIDYLTFETNVTQYQRQSKVPKRTKIWDGDKLTFVFDWERNLVLWQNLGVYGNVEIRVDERILDYVAARGEIPAYMIRSAPGKYNHHIHMHVEFEGE